MTNAPAPKRKSKIYLDFFRNRNSEFQGLLDGCLHVYLDVGSHHGIQVSFHRGSLKFLTYAAIFFFPHAVDSQALPARPLPEGKGAAYLQFQFRRGYHGKECVYHTTMREKKTLPEIKNICFPRRPDEARCLRSGLRGKPLSNQHVSQAC